MNTRRLLFPLATLSLLYATACSGGRDVEVTGSIGSGVAAAEPVRVEFYDVIGEGEDRSLELVHDISLTTEREFAETVALEGDFVLVRAIHDADADGACTEGESWAEQEAAIAEDDSVEAVSLDLKAQACPVQE